MAEIAQGGGGGKGDKVRSKKMSTKIDMTPMVDLGFLLITFFMLTTTLQKPVTMFLGMPDKDKEKEKQETMALKESESITILLDKKANSSDRIYWYQGTGKEVATTEVEKTNFSPEGIRMVLRRKKQEVGEKFFVVIKATDGATYKALIDTLDEMAITKIDKYAIAELNLNDVKIIEKAESAAAAK